MSTTQVIRRGPLHDRWALAVKWGLYHIVRPLLQLWYWWGNAGYTPK